MRTARSRAASRVKSSDQDNGGGNRRLRLVGCRGVEHRRPPNPLVERYVRYERHNRRRARNTLKLKRLVLGHLVQFLAARFDVDAGDQDVLLLAELGDLQAWQESLRMMDSSAATYTSQVRAFYRWAASARSERLLLVNPAEELLVPDAPKGVPHPIADDDLYLALDVAAASDPRMYAWLLLGAACGLRCCEIAALDCRDIRIDERSQTARIRVVNSKGGKSRTRDGGPGLVAALAPFKRGRKAGPLFTSVERATGRPRQIPAELVSLYISRFLRRLGLADTAHSLRHWFGSSSYAAKRDLRATQEALGHSSPTVTAVYTAIVDADGGALGQVMDQILISRGRLDPRRRAGPGAPAEQLGPEYWVLQLRLDGKDWADIAETFGITEDDARRIARTAFGADEQAS